jgi:hypothetical protein
MLLNIKVANISPLDLSNCPTSKIKKINKASTLVTAMEK